MRLATQWRQKNETFRRWRGREQRLLGNQWRYQRIHWWQLNAGLAFKAGHYGGVFKGGDGFDTLVFDHGTHGPGTSQMYVGLDAGFAMFGGNVGSPMVQFADVGTGTYTLDWERLEMRGDSDDFVVVGGGLQGKTIPWRRAPWTQRTSSRSIWEAAMTSSM